ncbi:hypothetical protein E2C01_043858 [Portunus trituberculatus]|uniref:Uncharacterized protein n=1 Tax=Portunus trituberculatus TaxID=210409 RepID=A0A5B7FX91_PORTR|nr:hypothetical protein [Portunus trituberculatus]
MSQPCGLSDERTQKLVAEETVDFTDAITFTEAYEPVTADLGYHGCHPQPGVPHQEGFNNKHFTLASLDLKGVSDCFT